jgi:deoxyribodipyrimidine photo-lyase
MVANRILLLEPSHFHRFPVCERTLQFILELSRNIPDVQIFTGEFRELSENIDPDTTYFREHPLFNHWQGRQEDREWMFPDITASSGGFFGFWKKCERRL